MGILTQSNGILALEITNNIKKTEKYERINTCQAFSVVGFYPKPWQAKRESLFVWLSYGN